MNKACFIYFHPDSAPAISDLPDRYQDNVVKRSAAGDSREELALGVEVGHAFYIDFYPKLLRTRIGGKEASPVDFYVPNILFIEWFTEGAN